ncbi:response regulator transcription factor [Streptomyces sp. NPDC058251]|uniref:response regulator transcription factor n=1 Tax=unclassified Streptomyces TaxID=2593676 RepID=UPI003656C816
MAHVMIIEDEGQIRHALADSLRKLKHDVQTAECGSIGLSRVVTERPDIVVLDLGLPDLDGISVLKMLRTAVDIPIVVVTACDDEQVTIRALELGADDFLVKPLSAAHLNARITAILRRSEPDHAASEIRLGNLFIDLRAHVATLDGAVLDLRPKEFRLLAYLATHAGRVVSKEELLTEIWDRAYGVTDKTVDVHLSWLRRRLGETAVQPRYLQSVRGVGVKLVDPGP